MKDVRTRTKTRAQPPYKVDQFVPQSKLIYILNQLQYNIMIAERLVYDMVKITVQDTIRGMYGDYNPTTVLEFFNFAKSRISTKGDGVIFMYYTIFAYLSSQYVILKHELDDDKRYTHEKLKDTNFKAMNSILNTMKAKGFRPITTF
jgi:hypothetical protein